MINSMLNIIKKNLTPDIKDDILLSILFEMSRYFDFKLKDFYKESQKSHRKKFSTVERKLLRHYFYYGGESILKDIGLESFNRMVYNESDIKIILTNTIERLNKYDSEKIYRTIEKRYSELNELFCDTKNYQKWLKWHDNKRTKENKCDLFVFKIDQKFFDVNYKKSIYSELQKAFLSLNNYRYLTIIVDGNIFCNGLDITWKLIYKLSIYLENLSSYIKPFFPFKKENRIDDLKNFLISKNIDSKKSEIIASNFYSSICTGFKFEDLLISEDYSKKILTFKKIVLDNSFVPCPSCLDTIESGNSFPEMFLRSWECKNPNCPSRSKSGRGKRFDEFGVYKYFKTINNEHDIISEQIYSKCRRDIFPKDTNIVELIVKLYSWTNEIVYTSNITFDNQYDRKIISAVGISVNNGDFVLFDSFENLPIFKTLKMIFNEFNNKTSDVKLEKKIELFNDNSTIGIKNLFPNQIGCAITSPPYYNAREYSQWQNMLLYLVDMMDNANSVFNSMCSKGTYLYNIGDIVSADNIYVESNMSKRRQMLGFYSMMIFEIVGFHVSTNIIWDKGEVQSKRNSTINMYPFYVKCINCYEHIIVFTKNKVNINPDNFIIRINPVIKINSKGENKFGHTAPYPIELVDTIKKFVIDGKYVLDPFLGSGTTLIWCKLNSVNGVGFEMNTEYFTLANNRIIATKKVTN